MNRFATILNAAELKADFELTASLDPEFARRSRLYWEGRTDDQLRTLRSGAWQANDGYTFQLAASYLALRGSQY